MGQQPVAMTAESAIPGDSKPHRTDAVAPILRPISYAASVGGERHHCADLRAMLAKATPARSGDELAGLAACSARERVAAQEALADLPIATFLSQALVSYEANAVTRLIIDSHDPLAFAPVAHLSVAPFAIGYWATRSTLSRWPRTDLDTATPWS